MREQVRSDSPFLWCLPRLERSAPGLGTLSLLSTSLKPFQTMMFSSSPALPFGAFTFLVPFLVSCGNLFAFPPQNVLQSFQQQYSGVQAQWEEQPYGYEAVFVQNGLEYEAEYSSTGEWLETEYEVQESQFSAAVVQQVRKEYPGFTITKYEIELTPQGTFYEVKIENKGQERELYFNDRAIPVANANEDA